MLLNTLCPCECENSITPFSTIQWLWLFVLSTAILLLKRMRINHLLLFITLAHDYIQYQINNNKQCFIVNWITFSANMIYRLLKYYFGFCLIILHIEINGKFIFKTLFRFEFEFVEFNHGVHSCASYLHLHIYTFIRENFSENYKFSMWMTITRVSIHTHTHSTAFQKYYCHFRSSIVRIILQFYMYTTQIVTNSKSNNVKMANICMRMLIWCLTGGVATYHG